MASDTFLDPHLISKLSVLMMLSTCQAGFYHILCMAFFVDNCTHRSIKRQHGVSQILVHSEGKTECEVT